MSAVERGGGGRAGGISARRRLLACAVLALAAVAMLSVAVALAGRRATAPGAGTPALPAAVPPQSAGPADAAPGRPRAGAPQQPDRQPVVRGRVVDAASGAAVARFCVALAPLQDEVAHPADGPLPGAPWTAAADGRFAVVAAAPGPHVLRVFTEEGVPVHLRLDLAPGAEVELPVRVRPGVRVRGFVRDAGGRPVAAARVTLRQHGGGLEAAVPTGADGAFALPPMPPGAHELRIAAAGLPFLRVPALRLETGAPPVLDLLLPAGAALSGTVRPWRPGQLAEVVIAHVEGPVRRVPVDVATGAYAAGGLTPGGHRVSVERGEVHWRSRVAALLAGYAAPEVWLQAGQRARHDPADPVASMARVRGVVEGLAAGVALTVRAVREDAPLPPPAAGLFRTALLPDGGFVLDGLLPGQWHLAVEDRTGPVLRVPLAVAAGDDLECAIRLPARGR